MTTASVTFRFAYSPDGTKKIINTTAVPSGELWRVDTVTVYSDGAGSASTLGYNFAVFEDGTTPAAVDVSAGRGGVSGTADGTTVSASVSSVGIYATDLEHLLFSDTSGTSDGSTQTVVVSARRVI